MDTRNSTQELESSPTSLHRSKGMADFSHLLSRRRRSSRASENRLYLSERRRSQSKASEDSQILYMSASNLKATKTRRKIGRSLSSRSNSAGRINDHLYDTPKEHDDSEESMSRNAIDREIFEWQYVCQTGRPYWWSPQSKYARLQKLQQRMAKEHNAEAQAYTSKTDSPAQHDMRRQTVSDSYFAEQTSFHDLAHTIAVRLLGACLTLHPDSITAVTPEYTRNDDGVSELRAPQLISSLRMHTHFRYSPSFGHQARNTSPVQLWPGRFDGPKSSSSPVGSNTGTSTPNIGTSSPCSRRPRLHRALNNTEGSETREEDEEDEEDYIRTCDNNELDPTVQNRAWYSREGIQDSNNRAFILSHMSGSARRRRPTRTPEPSREDIPSPSTAVTSAPKSRYRLQPVIRSEPHHVFIQPVRELVVKRWRNFRRRFSGSLHSSIPAGGYDEVGSASESSASGVSSPLLSGDAKARRLRAQERGDIHSSSVDSTPHYNTPISGHLSPSNNVLPRRNRDDSQNATPAFQFADPLVAAASLVAAERTQAGSMPSSPSIVTPLESEGIGLSPTWSTSATGGNSPQVELTFFPSYSKPNTPSSPRTFSSQRSVGRPKRRSMLSEVCTPEDPWSPESFQSGSRQPPFDRNILSAMGSALASPGEGITPDFLSGGKPVYQTLSIPGHTVLPILGEVRPVNVRKRPRVARTSTSGTQIFTPHDDGVEIDGMPVGPPRDAWVGKGSRREHTLL